MTNAELLIHLERRGIVARISQFDGGQTIRWFTGITGTVAITSEWGDPSLADLVRDRLPYLFPEDDPFIQDEPVIKETY